GACLMVPSPLAGEGQGGGYNVHCACLKSDVPAPAFPTASPMLRVLSPPLSLYLPRKGGGNAVAPLCTTSGLSICVSYRIAKMLIRCLHVLLCHDSHSAPQRVLLEGRVATRELAGVLPTLTRPRPVTVACSVFLDCTLSTLMRSPCAPGSSA